MIGLRGIVVAGLLALLAPPAAHAVPSTFGPVIGSALLCRSHLENRYFQAYLKQAFGPSYKHEGGAFWFKTEATLWGQSVTDVLISDDSSDIVFIGAVANTAADKLEQAIRSAVGVRHQSIGRSAAPVRESAPGSKIVYFDTKSKIYCARSKAMKAAR